MCFDDSGGFRLVKTSRFPPDKYRENAVVELSVLVTTAVYLGAPIPPRDEMQALSRSV
jgi:hypothetical protein